MTIKRVVNGETMVFDLTSNELNLAYAELTRKTYETEIDEAIDRMDDRLMFNFVVSRDDFINECVDQLLDEDMGRNDESRFDDVVFDEALSYGILMESDEE